MLTARGGGLERNPGAVRLLETLGNVTFLERPFHPTTLVSLARAARRARLRQYEARARLEDIHAGQERLRVALAAGGLGAWTIDSRPTRWTRRPRARRITAARADEPFGYRRSARGDPSRRSRSDARGGRPIAGDGRGL